MKTYLVAAAALSVLGATSALAQDAGERNGHGHWQGGQGGAEHGQPQGRQGGQGQWQGRQAGGQDQSHGRQAGGGQHLQSQGRPEGAQAGQWRGRQGGGQAASRPDWNAYMRNNPDLQRAYRENRSRPGYTESQQQFAERHWREHGQSEGRALPQSSAPARLGERGGDRNRLGGGRDDRGDQHWNGAREERRWNGDRSDRGDRRDNDRNRWSSNRGWDGRMWQGRDYRRNWTAQRRFHVGSYYRPRGWYYRRWTYGQILPNLFWGSNYWIDDYFAYGLPLPPPGTVWVRYGPDALLIDRDSGEIIQVVYNIFY